MFSEKVEIMLVKTYLDSTLQFKHIVFYFLKQKGWELFFFFFSISPSLFFFLIKKGNGPKKVQSVISYLD